MAEAGEEEEEAANAFGSWLPLLTIVASLLLVVTSALNFSVFLRQLRASREQLETARRQLENARQGPEILLVQRAMSETSDHLKILIDKPYLRPYFYDNRPWTEGDRASVAPRRLRTILHPGRRDQSRGPRAGTVYGNESGGHRRAAH